MDFLDNIALPQSHEHLILLKYLLALTFTLFVPYLAVLIGSTFFALLLKSKGTNDGENKYIKLARDLVNLATLNKSVVFALGIIPLISAVFCYTQILQGSGALVSLYLLLAFIAFTAAILLLFSFKNSFNLSSIFSYISKKNYDIEEDDTKESFDVYKSKTARQFEKSGIWSLVLLVLTAVLFIASVELAANSEMWAADYALIKTIFSVSTISYLLYFLAASITITSAVILFYYYRIKTNIQKDSELFSTARNQAVTWGLVSVIIQPFLIALNLMFTPAGSLSSMAFVVILISIIVLLFTASLFYFMLKDEKTNYVVPILVLSILVFVFSNVKDQLSFAAASKEQLARLENNFIAYEEEFKAGLGIAAVEISGEEIFNGQCVACHQFEEVVVGPAYKDVMPKYEGKITDLVEYIRNPVKVDPAFPPMPDPGLSPAEAKAVADYEMTEHMKLVFSERAGEAGEDGQRLHELICAACHSFESDMVGPAFNDVLSKYEGNEDDLVTFLSDPQKINPDFPQMPNPQLSEQQMKAVSTYVVEEYRRRSELASQ